MDFQPTSSSSTTHHQDHDDDDDGVVVDQDEEGTSIAQNRPRRAATGAVVSYEDAGSDAGSDVAMTTTSSSGPSRNTTTGRLLRSNTATTASASSSQPHQKARHNHQVCSVCYDGLPNSSYMICECCGAALHTGCMKVDPNPDIFALIAIKPIPGINAVLCPFCRTAYRAKKMGAAFKDVSELICVVCGNSGFGVMIPTKKAELLGNTWAHLVCGRYTDGLALSREVIKGFKYGMDDKEDRLKAINKSNPEEVRAAMQRETCSICHETTGLVTQCKECLRIRSAQQQNGVPGPDVVRFHAYCAVSKANARTVDDGYEVPGILCAKHSNLVANGGVATSSSSSQDAPATTTDNGFEQDTASLAPTAALSQSSQDSSYSDRLAASTTKSLSIPFHALDVCGVCFSKRAPHDDDEDQLPNGTSSSSSSSSAPLASTTVSSSPASTLLCCDGCGVRVHGECYGVFVPPPSIPQEGSDDVMTPAPPPWYCRYCVSNEHARGVLGECILCPHLGGALSPVEHNDLDFVHTVCALYIPEVSFGDVDTLCPVRLPNPLADLFKKRGTNMCSLCRQKGGVAIQCADSKCFKWFHVSCAALARNSKHHGTSSSTRRKSNNGRMNHDDDEEENADDQEGEAKFEMFCKLHSENPAECLTAVSIMEQPIGSGMAAKRRAVSGAYVWGRAKIQREVVRYEQQRQQASSSSSSAPPPADINTTDDDGGNAMNRVYSAWCGLDDGSREEYEEEARKLSGGPPAAATATTTPDELVLEELRQCVARAWTKSLPRRGTTGAGGGADEQGENLPSSRRRKRRTDYWSEFVDSSNYDSISTAAGGSSSRGQAAAGASSSTSATRGAKGLASSASSTLRSSALRGDDGKALDLDKVDKEFNKLQGELDDFMVQIHRARSRDGFLGDASLKCGPPVLLLGEDAVHTQQSVQMLEQRKFQDPFFHHPAKSPADRFSLVEIANHFKIEGQGSGDLGATIFQARPQVMYEPIVMAACGGFPVAACTTPHHVVLVAMNNNTREIESAAHAAYWKDSTLFVRVAATSGPVFTKRAAIFAKLLLSGPPMNEVTFYPLQGNSWNTVLSGPAIQAHEVTGDMSSTNLPFRVNVGAVLRAVLSVSWAPQVPAADFFEKLELDAGNSGERFFAQWDLSGTTTTNNTASGTGEVVFSMWGKRNDQGVLSEVHSFGGGGGTRAGGAAGELGVETNLTLVRAEANVNELLVPGTLLHRLEQARKELVSSSQNVSTMLKVLTTRSEERKSRLATLEANKAMELKCLERVKVARKLEEEQRIRQQHIEESRCHACGDGESIDGNAIVFCDRCDMGYHQRCIGMEVIPSGEWFCEVCRGEVPAAVRTKRMQKAVAAATARNNASNAANNNRPLKKDVTKKATQLTKRRKELTNGESGGGGAASSSLDLLIALSLNGMVDGGEAAASSGGAGGAGSSILGCRICATSRSPPMFPPDEPMVTCGRCDLKFHVKCAGLKDDAIPAPRTWFCSPCEESRKRRPRPPRSASADYVNGQVGSSSSSASTSAVDAVNSTLEAPPPPVGDGEVYCLCKKPDDGSFFLECDACEKWFHPKCVGLKQCDDPTHPKCFLNMDLTRITHPVDVSEGWTFLCGRCARRRSGRLMKTQPRHKLLKLRGIHHMAAASSASLPNNGQGSDGDDDYGAE